MSPSAEPRSSARDREPRPAPPPVPVAARALAVAAAIVLGLLAGIASARAGLADFGPTWPRRLAGVALGALVGASGAWIGARLAMTRCPQLRLRRAPHLGAWLGGMAVFLLGRLPLPWLGLDAVGLGGGPLGEVPLIVLPVAGLLAAVSTDAVARAR